MDSDHEYLAFRPGAMNPTLYNGAPRDRTPTEGLFPRSPSPDATRNTGSDVHTEPNVPPPTLDPSTLKRPQPHGCFTASARVDDGSSKA